MSTRTLADRLGRARNPESDEALARVNAERMIAAGRRSIRLRAHVPATYAEEWEAMTAAERGEVIRAGIDLIRNRRH